MSKHDLKAVKLQVQRLINKIVGGKILSDNPIVYSDDGFDMSDPNTLITRAFADANYGNTDDDPLEFSEGDLTLVEEGNYKLSFNLPDGKSIISIERLQEGVISRSVPISNAFTIIANNPNTTIEGFDNNLPQTIIIKIA